VPEFGAGSSSAAEATQTAPIAQSAEEPTIVLKVPTVGPAEAEDDKAEEPQVERVIEMPEILSPLAAADLPKMHRVPVVTPKRRMASVLDDVIETTKALSPAPTKKIAEAAKAQAEAETGRAEAEATKTQAEVEAGPSAPVAAKPVAPEEKTAGQIAPETPAPEAPIEIVDYIIRHASGKKLSEEEILEARHYARKLKYPKGALVFNDTNDDDFYTVSRTTKKYPFVER
jgi:hypothetical protein